jgi:phosphatidylglycerophosphatase A
MVVCYLPQRIWRRTNILDTNSNMAAKQPSWQFMRPRFSRWVAFGFGSGLAPIMPGTVGTLVAWFLYGLAQPALPSAWLWAVIGVSFLLGCWACERTGQDLGVPDHGAMVWDEFVAFWLVLAVLPPSFSWQLAGFVVFRFFDMVKPPPIGWLDRRVKGGLGVMLDDLVAALFTLLLLAFWR